jgi:hypothetical protein
LLTGYSASSLRSESFWNSFVITLTLLKPARLCLTLTEHYLQKLAGCGDADVYRLVKFTIDTTHQTFCTLPQVRDPKLNPEYLAMTMFVFASNTVEVTKVPPGLLTDCLSHTCRDVVDTHA